MQKQHLRMSDNHVKLANRFPLIACSIDYHSSCVHQYRFRLGQNVATAVLSGLL